MKKRIITISSIVLSSVIVAVGIFCAVWFTHKFKVSFLNADGTNCCVQKINRNGFATYIDAPICDENEVFLGWFEDVNDWSTYFDYNQAIKSNKKLYPKFLSLNKESIDTNSQNYYNEFVSYNQFDTVPKITISTNNVAITNKEDYIEGTFSLDCSNDEFDLVDKNMEIRLRGSASLSYQKKSYKIKFDKKSTSVFGNSGNKHWALVANYLDRTLMRNYISYTLSQSFSNLGFVPKIYYVDVELNGKFLGNFLLIETIEVSDVRLDLDSNPTAENYDTGFLFEKTNTIEGQENIDYLLLNDSIYDIKYPKIDDDIIVDNYLNILNYAKNYINNVNAVIKSKNYQKFLELCDENSFIDYFLINDITNNLDSFLRSAYLYKKAGGKMFLGPVWDYDQTFGTYPLESSKKIDGQRLIETSEWFADLLQIPQFKTKYVARYNELYNTNIKYLYNSMDNIFRYNYVSAEQNFEVWTNCFNPLQTEFATVLKHLTTIGEQYGFLKYYYSQRIEFLHKLYNNL